MKLRPLILIIAALSTFSANARAQMLRKAALCVRDNLRALVNAPDGSAASTEKMIEQLQAKYGVVVEYDASLSAKRVAGKSLYQRRAIQLASRTKTEFNKSVLLHEVVHANTDRLITHKPSIENFAQGVRFSGMLMDAPAGYRLGFRLDELAAYKKQLIYMQTIVDSPNTSFVLRRKTLAQIREREYLFNKFKESSAQFLKDVRTKLDAAYAANPHDPKILSVEKRAEAPGIVNINVSVPEEGYFGFHVQVPYLEGAQGSSAISSAALKEAVDCVLSAAEDLVNKSALPGKITRR